MPDSARARNEMAGPQAEEILTVFFSQHKKTSVMLMVILKIGGFLWSSGGTIDLSSLSGIRVNKRQPSSKVHWQKKDKRKKKKDYKIMKKALMKCF